MLLLIVAAFVVAGITCARRVTSALTQLDKSGPEMAAGMMLRKQTVGAAKALGRQMRQEVVATTAFVFVAFLLRSVVSTILAVANQLQDSDKDCSRASVIGANTLFCDASCYNAFTHIWMWNLFTPEFLPVVVFVSSPVALLVALRGVTSKLALQTMRSSKRGVTSKLTLQAMRSNKL